MAKAAAKAIINVPIATVFSYVDVWSNATKYNKELQTWEPIGEQSHGLGSKFHAVMKFGPITQEATLEVTRWEQDKVIGWEPRSGFQQSGVYEFRAVGDTTEASLTVDFSLPGGLAGKLLGKTIEPIVKMSVADTVKNLKAILEADA